jgi:hypothetical protein
VRAEGRGRRVHYCRLERRRGAPSNRGPATCRNFLHTVARCFRGATR